MRRRAVRRPIMMLHILNAIALASCFVLAGTPLAAQTLETPEARLARIQVEQIPIGATVNVRTRDGERLRAVLFSIGESDVRVKLVTRLPEPSRLIAFDRIERIERHVDHVSVRKYVGVGVGIGAAVLLGLLAGL
jgi:hypothetical protein